MAVLRSCWLTLYFRIFVLQKRCYYLTMSPKKGRRVRKIEVSNDSVPEFELRGTAMDIQWRSQEREARERGRHSNRGSDTETEAGGEAGSSQS